MPVPITGIAEISKKSLFSLIQSIQIQPKQTQVTHRQFAANPRQFAANPRRVKTSPSHPGCRPPTHLLLCTPPPPPGGEGGSSADPFGRSKFPATPTRTPRHLTPLGSESGPAVQDTVILPAYPSLAPRGSAPHLLGEGSEPAGRLGQDLQLCLAHLLSTPPETDRTRHPGLTLSVPVPA
jgi:hypothetical protein